MATSPLVTSTVPMTLLDAVNRVLQAARITQISTLANIENNEDAASAKQAVDDASQEVQMEKWEFNRFPEYRITGTLWTGGGTVSPDGPVTLNVPPNTLSVNSGRTTPGAARLVFASGYLADRKTGKFIFPNGTTAIVDLTLLLEFRAIPPAARNLITAMAAKAWALPRLPSGATFRYTDDYIAHARALLEREDADAIDGDHETRSPHFAKHRRR